MKYLKKFFIHRIGKTRIYEFHNSTSLWKTGVNYPETETHPTLHPDSLGKDYNYLTVSEIFIYLNQNNKIKKDIEKSGNSIKISFEAHGLNVSVYRSLVDKNNFEYLVEIDGKEIDCKNEIGERMFTLLYSRYVSENINIDGSTNKNKFNEAIKIFNEYKYILEDEGVRARARESFYPWYTATDTRITHYLNIFMDIKNTPIFRACDRCKPDVEFDANRKFIKSDCYKEFIDRFLEDIYTEKISNSGKVSVKFAEDGILLNIIYT